MLWLSDASIDYGVRMCIDKGRYISVIGVNRRSEIRTVIEKVVDSFRKQAGATAELTIRNNTVMYNNTGSYVKVLPATENSRGNRAHLLLMDEFVDREIISTVFRPMERDYNRLYGFGTDVQFMDEVRENNDTLWTITIYDDELEEDTETMTVEGVVSEDELMQILGY